MSPFGGLRMFLRSIQGLVNQMEELDELLSKILKDELMEGIVARIADDLFVGGNTKEEAIENWTKVLSRLDSCNIKLSATKTHIFPSSVDLLEWVWKQGGKVCPSPHKQLALRDAEEPAKVKDMRSYVGLFFFSGDPYGSRKLFIDSY